MSSIQPSPSGQQVPATQVANLLNQLGNLLQQPESAFGAAYNVIKSVVGPVFDQVAAKCSGKFKGTHVEKAAVFTATVVASAVIAKIALDNAGTKFPDNAVAKHFESHLAAQVHRAALDIDEAINVTAVRNPLLNLGNALAAQSKEEIKG